MPAHKHTLTQQVIGWALNEAGAAYGTWVGSGKVPGSKGVTETKNIGNGTAHNNMPPYYTVCIWIRIA